MRAWGGFALALSLLLVTAPATGSHASPATVLLFDEVDSFPHWHSVIVSWDDTKVLAGDIIREKPRAGELALGSDDPMGGSAVFFEYRDPDGSWRWFASLGSVGSEQSWNDARVRVLAPVSLDVEHHPYLRLIQNSSLGWSLTGTAGMYRITTFAAAQYEGNARFLLRGEQGVTLLNHTEGEHAGFKRADDTALASAGANALGQGVWARTLANVDMSFERSAYIFDTVGLPPYDGCVCRYAGPHPQWDGRVRTTTPGHIFAGPPGTYTVDVLASENSWVHIDPGNPTRIVPQNLNDALAWVYADVIAAEA